MVSISKLPDEAGKFSPASHARLMMEMSFPMATRLHTAMTPKSNGEVMVPVRSMLSPSTSPLEGLTDSWPEALAGAAGSSARVAASTSAAADETAARLTETIDRRRRCPPIARRSPNPVERWSPIAATLRGHPVGCTPKVRHPATPPLAKTSGSHEAEFAAAACGGERKR